MVGGMADPTVLVLVLSSIAVFDFVGDVVIVVDNTCC